jgi:hypothetical protein
MTGWTARADQPDLRTPGIVTDSQPASGFDACSGFRARPGGASGKQRFEKCAEPDWLDQGRDTWIPDLHAGRPKRRCFAAATTPVPLISVTGAQPIRTVPPLTPPGLIDVQTLNAGHRLMPD